LRNNTEILTYKSELCNCGLLYCKAGQTQERYGRPTLWEPCVFITRLITSETSTRGSSRWWTIYFFFKSNGSI